MSVFVGLLTDDRRHCTLLYSEKASIEDLAEIRPLVRRIWNAYGPRFMVPVKETAWFGLDHDVPVMRLAPSYQIDMMRECLAGFHDSHFGFDPHVSLEGGDTMDAVAFVGIKVAYSETFGVVESME